MIVYIHTRFKNIVVERMDRKFIKEQIVDESYVNRLKRVLKLFNILINSKYDNKKIVSIVTKIVQQTYRYNEKNWINRLGDFGIDLKEDVSYSFLKDFLKLRIQSNVNIIKNLKNNIINSLEETVYRNFEQGKTFKELSKELENRLGIDKRKAILIARNEIKNTHRELDKKRMMEYGITHATWEDSHDERVRKQHKKFNGRRYEIGIGLKNEKGIFVEPGEEVDCRCVAIPEI